MSSRLACFVALAIVTVSFSPIAASDEVLTFEQHVRPILKAHCFQCHGDEGKHEGNLDLRLVRMMTQGGDSGPAVAAGKASESYLIERIVAGDMPPEGKKLPEQDLLTLRTWIDQGAKTARPEPETLADFTEEELSFWSLQPIASPPLPVVSDPELLRSPIDSFLLARLEQRGLSFSPAADRRTLVRRAYYDLVGLPPAPDEVDAFLADESPDAFERLTDRLLAQPQYGERWGRHWLDVAGYADSNGYTEKDSERKYAFKYRDYVIRSFNADKPWDAFLREQLAGDEMLAPPYANLTAEQADLLAATGFLRMAPDGTGDGAPDPILARNDVVAETIKIVTSSVLGLTVGCAQCHNHRYDPIPQADYYRLRAIFEPALDTKNWRPPQARLVSLWSDAVREEARSIDTELSNLRDERFAELDKIVAEIFETEVARLPAELQDPARVARKTPVLERTPDQQQIMKDHPSLNVNRGSAYLYDRKRVDAFNKQYDARQKDLETRRPKEDFVPCLTEVPGQAPATHVFYRGDVTQPRDAVQPGELSVLTAPRSAADAASYSTLAAIAADDPALPTSGRRLAYARWLTSGQHPLVGRVLVNRVWLLHFGRGLVATPGDFGQLGSPPTHPKLLDWLATEFTHRRHLAPRDAIGPPSATTIAPEDASPHAEREAYGGWQLKRFHRLLVNSTAYRQSSRRRPELDQLDVENTLLGRMSIRRLEAEAVRDSVLAASGFLNYEQLGEPVPVTVDEVGQVIVGLDNRDSAGRPEGKRKSLGADEFRRSVYVQVRRSQPLSMLETFDAATLAPNCELRTQSTVAPQSLLLMNSDFILTQSQALAERAIAQAGSDPAACVRLVWRLAVATEPTDSQLAAATAFLADQQRAIESQPPPTASASLPPPPVRALASLCQALFSSNAFLYVD